MNMTATPTGNTYDKYASKNPIEQRMMAGFMKALDGMLEGLEPTRILEVGVGEGEVMARVRERFPGVPIMVITLTNGWRPGYLPTADAYGKGIYQETIALLAAGTLEQLLDAVGEQVKAFLAPLAGSPRPID